MRSTVFPGHCNFVVFYTYFGHAPEQLFEYLRVELEPRDFCPFHRFKSHYDCTTLRQERGPVDGAHFQNLLPWT
jgi:hypothetical protein